MRRVALLGSLIFVVACSDTSERVLGPEGSGPVSPAAARVERPQQIPAFQPGVVVARFRPAVPAAEVAAAPPSSTWRAWRGPRTAPMR